MTGVNENNRRMYFYLLILTLAASLGLEGWRMLLNNYAVEVVGLGGLEIGTVQSVREIPGFLALLVIYLLFIFTEHRLAALSILIMGAGIMLTGALPSYLGVLGTTLLMSFGFHYFETVNQSLTLQYFDITAAPVVSGKLRAWGSVGRLATAGVMFVVASFLEYSSMFYLVGGAVALMGVWAIVQDPSDKQMTPQRKKMILRRRYWLFYALTFLAGARRQIFIAFALFLMVVKFKFSVQTVTILFVINNAINLWVSPAIGRAINRFGERWVLTLEYGALIVVFSVYALSDNGLLVSVMYVLDHIFFNFAIAIRTFFQKIADKADVAPSMAVGFTINHIAAVLIPVLGGLMWLSDYRLVFLAGAVLSLCSLILVQFIPRELQKKSS